VTVRCNRKDGKRMKKIAVSIIILLLTAGFAYAKNYELTKKTGDYTIKLSMDKSPSMGKNNVTIDIKDTQGKAVNSQSVVVSYSMPAMPGMPPMNYKTKAVQKNGAYKATLEICMAGPWTIEVKFNAGSTRTAKFNIDVN
jgi:nitrogen fixation protein FixH